MSALVLPRERCATFTRNGLGCYRMPMPHGLEDEPRVAWVAGSPLGCVTLVAAPVPWPSFPGGVLDAAGVTWAPYLLSAHTPKPSSSSDPETPDIGSCLFLDGLPCWTGDSGIGAMQVLEKAAMAGREEVIWDQLAVYHRIWIVDDLCGELPGVGDLNEDAADDEDGDEDDVNPVSVHVDPVV